MEEVKPKKTFMDKFVSSAGSPKKSSTPAKPVKDEKKDKTVVSAADFFGGATVHRVERKTLPAKMEEIVVVCLISISEFRLFYLFLLTIKT